jgi:tetratricopeptide (TPR) repeat protein
MSIRHLLILVALTPVFACSSKAQTQTPAGAVSVADLLLKDDIQKAEQALQSAPRTAENVAYQGEVEYRKGNFDKAKSLYESALQMNEKTARAHFGIGKLALAKVKPKESFQSFKRAIDLQPNEPLYHFYASMAADLDKNTAESKKQLEEYVRLNPQGDADRLTEAKAGLALAAAFGNKEYAVVDGPKEPQPIPLRKAINLIFADVKIDGKGPYNFVVDTGASQTALSQKLARDLGLGVITSTIMHGVGGSGKVDSKIYRLDRLQIGEVTVKDLPVGL